MSWNYRVVVNEYAEGETTFALHEAYYDAAGKVNGVTVRPVHLEGYESVQALVDALTLMLSDVTRGRPLLTPEGKEA